MPSSQFKKKPTRNKLLGAIFTNAHKRGITDEQLRDDIAIAVTGKRLSKCTAPELMKVLTHIAGKKSYPLSLKGLKMEIEDLARDRFGEDYEEALNNFIRGFAFKTEHHKWLSLNEAKVIKNRLLELNSEGSHG